MDDRSSPSRHVRSNLEGLGRVFPAPYLFSYIMQDATEPLTVDTDLNLIGVSWMPGTVGVSMDFGLLSEADFGRLNRQVKLATSLRPLQADAVTLLLTPPASAEPDWEVVEQVSVSTGRGLLFAFSGPDAGDARIRLQRLDRTGIYEVRSSDQRLIGRFTGALLTDVGLAIERVDGSSAQIITFGPVSSTR